MSWQVSIVKCSNHIHTKDIDSWLFTPFTLLRLSPTTTYASLTKQMLPLYTVHAVVERVNTLTQVKGVALVFFLSIAQAAAHLGIFQYRAFANFCLRE